MDTSRIDFQTCPSKPEPASGKHLAWLDSDWPVTERPQFHPDAGICFALSENCAGRDGSTVYESERSEQFAMMGFIQSSDADF